MHILTKSQSFHLHVFEVWMMFCWTPSVKGLPSIDPSSHSFEAIIGRVTLRVSLSHVVESNELHGDYLLVQF